MLHPLVIFTLKSILRQKKKNYENSNIISPCKNRLIFKKQIVWKKPKSFKILLQLYNN
jgi:hypothetical protein